LHLAVFILFKNKLTTQQYISTYLYEIVNREMSEIIPSDFNLDVYNNKIIERDYLKYQDYFKKMYYEIDPSIHLDKEQIKAILSDEDYCLIIAGAGTGKQQPWLRKLNI